MSVNDLRIVSEDKLKRSFVLPKRILWQGDGVEQGELLLESTLSQIFVGVKNVTKLTSEQGKKSGILLDFGSEMVGSLELLVSKVSNYQEAKIRVRFGESASEAMTPIAEKNATNDHAVRDMVVTVTNWSQQTFGYTGYRFVYLELEEEEKWVELAAVRGVLTLRDIPYLGTFECDDKELEQIYQVCAYTVHTNMQNMLWDGIKRDRLVWIGDTHPEMLAIRTVFGENDIVDDALRFIPETNILPELPNKHTTYAFWYLMILWDWYWYTGKSDLVWSLKEYWVGLTKQIIDLIHADEEELLHEEEFKAGFFVDWPTKGTEAATAGVYALFSIALRSAEKLCAVIGECELQKQCKEYADLLSQCKFAHDDRKQIVALMYMAGMLDDKETADILTKDGGKGMSTFLSYYILTSAESTSEMSTVQQMLKEYYGAMLKVGATTFWEDFDLDWYQEGARVDELPAEHGYDIHGDNGRFCYQGMRHSLCHGWSAGPAAFLAERVLGIEILEAGCKKIKIKPNLGDLQWAKGTYPTPYGLITVEVKKENGKQVISVDAPKEVSVS